MSASDTVAIVLTTIGGLTDQFRAVLPVLFPVIIGVVVLFYAWRKLHGAARGK